MDKKSLSIQNGSQIKNVKIFFSKSDPAQVLTGEFAGCLLVMEFAWDSNSFVGNEVRCVF